MAVVPPKAALLVEHAQNDWIHPEGGLSKGDNRHIAEHIGALVKSPGFSLRMLTETHLPDDSKFLASNHEGKEPGHIGDIPNPKKPGETTKLELLPQVSLKGTWGAQTIDEISVSDFDFVMEKFTHPDHMTLSSFKDLHGNRFADMPGALSHDLEKELKQRDINTIVVVGCHGEHCVSHTALDTQDLGYRTLIVDDAVVFHGAEDDRENKWNELRAKGILVVKMGDPVLEEVMNPK